ncbi:MULTISPECIES: hypothetical protein [Bacillus]|uniref:hypothetical protein n=1 Tax=Bacillus TaxID=1386 RepID=UPI00397E211D
MEDKVEDKMKNKQISVVHVVYGCIITLLIITCILAIAFGGNKDAGNQMNVMATGISVVLAVIAILMTLVDVAGQRQSIIDIKETAEKLNQSQTISQETLQKSIESLEKLIDFREELIKSVSEYKNGTEGLIQELFSKEKESVSKVEIEELLFKFNEKTSYLNSKVKNIVTGESLKLAEKDIILAFKRWVRKTYSQDQTAIFNDFLKAVLKRFKMNEFETIREYINLNKEDFLYYDAELAEKCINLNRIKTIGVIEYNEYNDVK